MTLPGFKRRDLLAAAGVFAAWPAVAQPPPQPAAGLVQVSLTTDKGVILLALEAVRAPLTTANFLRYVDARRYDGASFYRAARAAGAPTVGLIEGGLFGGSAQPFPPIAHESTAATGLAHKDGTISMARKGQGTATSDFFICSGPSSYLDAHPDAPGDNAGYAAFGQVVAGMEVVRAILAQPTSQEAQNPVMRGQMLSAPVAILQARRVA